MKELAWEHVTESAVSGALRLSEPQTILGRQIGRDREIDSSDPSLVCDQQTESFCELLEPGRKYVPRMEWRWNSSSSVSKADLEYAVRDTRGKRTAGSRQCVVDGSVIGLQLITGEPHVVEFSAPHE